MIDKKKILAIVPAILFGLVFILKAITSLLGADYDWDIDHGMYYGSRLLFGELIWTKEFYDKLPVGQFLFFFPALLGSIHIWQAISLSVIVMTAVFLWRGLINVLYYDWGLDKDLSNNIAIFSSFLYLYLVSVLPGSISTIDPFSASCVAISITLFLSSFRKIEDKIIKVDFGWLIAALLGSIAIAMRPYYLISVLLIGFWVPYRNMAIARKNIIRYSIWRVILDFTAWSSTIALFGLLLNFVPYLITGNTSTFIDGVYILAQKLNPQTIHEVFTAQANDLFASATLVFPLFVILTLFLLRILVAYLKQLIRGDNITTDVRFIDLLFVVVLFPLLLESLMLSRHYWGHYQELFIPYIIFSTAFILACVLSERSSGLFDFSVSLKLLLLLLFLVSSPIAKDIAINAYNLMHSSIYIHPDEDALILVKKTLDHQPKNQRNFICPQSMYIHWRLNESRHGFPHTANTIHIIDYMWWKNVRVPYGFKMPINKSQYYQMMDMSGPLFVFDLVQSSSVACMNPSSSAYFKFNRIELKDGRSLIIYKRKRL